MKKIFYVFAIGGFFISLISFASAASIFDITYPIAELGGCASQAECKIYCDNPDHEDACLAFAEKYSLKIQSSRGENVSARARLIKEQGGPGGCQSQKECRAYCETPTNQKECLDFAEQHNLIDKNEIKAARKVMEQGGPGGCKTEKECKVFCDKPENLETCLAFAEEHNLIGKEEAAKARQIVGRPGPGGCVGAACKDYCDKPENREVCFQFAVDNNLIAPSEIERVKKMKSAMEQGGPGGCKDEKECRAYCDNPDNFEACGEFAKKNGLIGEQEIKMMERGREMAKKVNEAGGPGGCKDEKECRAYCGQPEHVEECLAFAVQQGGVNLDEAKGMLEKFARAGLSAPAGAGGSQGSGYPEMRLGMPPSESGFPPMPMGKPVGDQDGQFQQRFEDRFKKFEQFRELEGQFRNSPEMMGNFQGPGGCKGPEECIKYCSDPEHRAECARVNPSAGAPPPGVMFRQVEPGSERDFRINGATTTPFGARQSFGEPRPGFSSATNTAGAVCAREYHPVCGSNNRTYPNECFAKKDNVAITKEGPCGVSSSGEEVRPEGNMMPSPDQFRQYQQPPQQYIPQYTQPPAVPEQPSAPQSRRFSGSLLSNLLEAFSNALRMR